MQTHHVDGPKKGRGKSIWQKLAQQPVAKQNIRHDLIFRTVPVATLKNSAINKANIE